MSTETFLLAVILALVLGVGLTALWFLTAARGADKTDSTDSDAAIQSALGAARGAAQTAVDATRPIADTLVRIESQMRDLEAQRQQMMGGLQQHLGALSRETVALSQALRAPNSRGRWGELTLRRVAELAGMAAECDFYEQLGSDQQRPDMIVRLPGGRTLAVDAKVPLSAYLDAEAATDPGTRDAALLRHAQQVLRHVNQLSSREYWAQLQPAPEMVVLFLAGDHFLSAALQRKPELLEKALAKRVLIATPVTLVSVLKGVSYGWRQEKLAQNAEELRKIGAEFYDRLRAFSETYSESGRHLAKALDAYNRTAASWDARVLPALRRVNALGIGGNSVPGKDEPPQIPQVDGAARVPQPLFEQTQRSRLGRLE